VKPVQKSTKFTSADTVGLLVNKKEETAKESAVDGKPFYPEVLISHVVTPFELYVHELQRKESLDK
jgi:hypothetical protein